MIWYITFKDIRSFFQSERKVFIWLLICMACASFALNYSYSFARYRGLIYEHNMGSDISRYRISCDSPVSCENFDDIMNSIGVKDLPAVKDYQLFASSEKGLRIAGSSDIFIELAAVTGIWIEGYYKSMPGSGGNVCVVDAEVIDYDGRLKMTGENFELDGEQFTIEGVYEDGRNKVIIPIDKFIEKYGIFDGLWITFEKGLSEDQERAFTEIVQSAIPHGRMSYPPKPGTEAEALTRSNQMQYTIIIVMLVVCLVSLIRYWQNVNLAAYTIYWINGASDRHIMGIAFCETFLLCISTYLAGLGLNAASRAVFLRSAPLTFNDIIIAFGIFFGTFALFTLINTAKICRTFKIANVRRD